MVVARQRPATARGVVFMLLEDELGHDQRRRPAPRLPTRIAWSCGRHPSPWWTGALERREGVVNVVASSLVEVADAPSSRRAEIRHIEPPAERETGRADRPQQEAGRRMRRADGTPPTLAAVVPAGHSFGRRGR